MRFFVSSANSSVSSDSGKDGKPSLNGSGQGHSLQSSLSGLPNLTPSKTRKSCKYMYLAIENRRKVFEVFNKHEALHKIQSMVVWKLGWNQFSKIFNMSTLTALYTNFLQHLFVGLNRMMDLWKLVQGTFYVLCYWQWHGFIFLFPWIKCTWYFYCAFTLKLYTHTSKSF